ncbi:MAG: hypothetical protein LBK01_02960 [Burkholderiaceae bacterium]|jgi:hypothetical protein|nr:hypothetical protein [Burkholderiaceae bacterium]
MARYKLWDKQETLYTPSGEAFTAEEYLGKNKWAGNPAIKVIICNAPINCGVFMEYSQTVAQYKKMGAAITDDMTDEEVLQAIEDFEDTPPVVDPSPEERMAAALELQNLMSMEDQQ